MGTLRLVMASANPHKVTEMLAILSEVFVGDSALEVLPRPADVPDVVEDADTLVGNARLKARALCTATGLPAVADDTGLFVEALHGQPGVHTARFAGPGATDAQNCDKLLDSLAEAGALLPGERRAEFRTVALVAWPDGTETWAEGAIPGSIAINRQGTSGFGYDPLFVPDHLVIDGAITENDGRTFAELGTDVKNDISHRSRAFRSLAPQLRDR